MHDPVSSFKVDFKTKRFVMLYKSQEKRFKSQRLLPERLRSTLSSDGTASDFLNNGDCITYIIISSRTVFSFAL